MFFSGKWRDKSGSGKAQGTAVHAPISSGCAGIPGAEMKKPEKNIQDALGGVLFHLLFWQAMQALTP